MVLFEPISQEEKCILDLVRFEDVLINYNKNYHLYVNFTLDPQLKGSTLDWIGIFKAGWNTYESFLAFEWGIGEPTDHSGRKRRLIFDSHYLKCAEFNVNYQFVYINKHLEILGVSHFFQFTGGDDGKNESFCLNASFISDGNIHNSTEYHTNRDEYIEYVKENMSAVKRARPSCSINLPNNWEQAYTSCWRCKSLLEMKNKHNEMIAKLQECTEQNEMLKTRLNKLETALENVWVPKTILDPWDEPSERMKFQHFVSLMTAPTEKSEGYEKGDHWAKQNLGFQPVENASSSYDYFSQDASSREILLKAIIGTQEDRIRELTRTVTQLVEENLVVVQQQAAAEIKLSN
uniref:SKICH domain-containing protein n=1 Tax=Rhodnius prolixus TaxID=13249 RepID=T1HR00_RHOPR